MRRYVVEVTRSGYREVDAEDYDAAEAIAYNLNACDGVVWSDFVDIVRSWEKEYDGKRWGDLSPEDRNILLADYKLIDAEAFMERGEHIKFEGDGMCFVELNAEDCYINGIVYEGELYIHEDEVIVYLRF